MFNRFFNRKKRTALRIRVSDPWDFQVEGTDNSVVCDFLEAVRDERREVWIVRSRSVIVAPKGQRGSLVVISNRHKDEELVEVWGGEEVSANFGVIPANAEPCPSDEAAAKSIPFGIGSVVAE
jgi:hypothetical protein